MKLLPLESCSPFRALEVPKGHLPPPQSCASAQLSVPLGTWVITHDGSHYKVNIFNRERRDVIDEVRYYMTK